MNISVIIPVYNAERFLKKAVESALQFDEVKEILLIEDGSPDQSLEVCQKLVDMDSRIKLIQHADKGNHGAGATRNLGLEMASQEYIAFLDADDYYLPNRFDAERELFKDPKIEGVFGAIGTAFLSEKGKEEYKNKFNSEITTVNYPAEGIEVFKGLLGVSKNTFGSFFSLIALTLKKTSLRGLTFNKDLRVHQDSDFIIKLAYQSHLKTGNINEPVSIRGVHDDNRITKIKLYSDQYKERQFLLWSSLKLWADKNKIQKVCHKTIQLHAATYELTQKKGLNKFLLLFQYLLKNPEILKTRYRFLYL
ncbi:MULTISPECIES: glycosyltransferase family 2 protein [Amniculibacterium]|uniref:glycosyltransferase family 2 protein n=1 Tax=Amniculibacterium TaxID=2715289 RepID=UPI000F596D59|nr:MULTISPECIES: glycosyltransferase family 2 protein [Amniculibacterium]